MNDISKRLRDLADEINDEPSEIDRLKAELSDRDAALMTWERVMMKAIGEDGVVSVAGAIEKLKAKVANLEREPAEKPEPARPWPPEGVAIEILCNFWLPRTSLGDGRYKHPESGSSVALSGWKWRYAPAPWDLAHDDAKVRIVNNRSVQGWSSREWKVGDIWNGGTIVHVEYREDV